MKAAVLYSGAIRTLPETIENNLKQFDGMDIDLYFSTWDHIGYSSRINSPDHIFSKRLLDGNTIVTEDVIKSIVPSNVNIKKIKIEHYVENKYHVDVANGFDNNGLSAQYYKILDCFNLLDQSIRYDIVARFRCDIILNNYVPNLLELISNNKIIFPSKIWYDYPWDASKRAINEMLWVSNSELAGKACKIYSNMPKISDIVSSRQYTAPNHGESICFMNLESEDMISNIHAFDFDYTVLR